MIIGFTGHKGILGKSILNSLKKSKKSGYKVSLYKNNILDFKKLKKWVSKVDIIIHLAAQAGVRYSINNPKIPKNKPRNPPTNAPMIPHLVPPNHLVPKAVAKKSTKRSKTIKTPKIPIAHQVKTSGSISLWISPPKKNTIPPGITGTNTPMSPRKIAANRTPQATLAQT